MTTLLTRFDENVAARPDTVACHFYAEDEWTTQTWAEHQRNLRLFGRALLARGLKKADTVGILGFNRPEWAASLLGTMAAGGAGAGIYTPNSPEQVRFILDHAKSRFVVVENAEQLAKVEEVRSTLPNLEHVIVMDAGDVRGDAISFADFLDSGADYPEEDLMAVQESLDTQDLATLIYTSGTTGVPKAVMLSHGNVIETVYAFAKMFTVTHEDVCFSYLPLAHIAEQMNSVVLPTYTGSTTYYVRSLESMPEDLRRARPTVFFAVPRVWEKFMSGILAKLNDAPPLRRGLANWARKVCYKVTVLGHAEKKPGPFLALQHKVAGKITFKVRHALGLDRAHLAVSGAAPVGRDVLDFFASLGLTIFEVWGLSETSGPATWNRPGSIQLGTVGPPIIGCEVRLADDGEVLVRGTNVFMGYLHNPEATAEAFDGEWFKTGDLGGFDENGYLQITGRKKALIITAGGKNIGPEGIEGALKECDLVADAVVVGDRQPFLAALLSLDAEGLERFGDAGDNPVENPRVREAIQAHIDDVNQRRSRVENIREFRILPRNLTIEDGELTPTMKVKRQPVHENWAALIDDIYGG